MTQDRWTALAASATGSSHTASGKHNQDSVASLSIGGWLIMAVADGHGSSRYVRSDRGSRFAVGVAIEMGRQAVEAGRPTAVLDSFAELVQRWRATVRNDLDREPLSPDEVALAGQAAQGEVAYGSTLMIAMLGPESVHVAQIGDGDIIVHRADGVVEVPIAHDDRLPSNQTTSLCQPDAHLLFRRADYDARTGSGAIDMIVMSTDGYGNSFAAHGWQARVGADLAGRLQRDGIDAVAAQLPVWLSESADAGGDDTTVVIGVDVGRMHELATFGVPSLESPGSTRSRQPAAAAVARKRPPWVLLAPVALVALAAGFLAGRSTADDTGATDLTTAVRPQETDATPTSSPTTAPTTAGPTTTDGSTTSTAQQVTTTAPPSEPIALSVSAGGTSFVRVIVGSDGSTGAELATSQVDLLPQRQAFDGVTSFRVLDDGRVRATVVSTSQLRILETGFSAGALALGDGLLLIVDQAMTRYAVFHTGDGSVVATGDVEAGQVGPAATGTKPGQQPAGNSGTVTT